MAGLYNLRGSSTCEPTSAPPMSCAKADAERAELESKSGRLVRRVIAVIGIHRGRKAY
jgi:hypothetical protein